MWDASNKSTSQSCTAFHKKKTDLLSVEYSNYIRKDVLNYLDQYPMRKSTQNPKKGSPNCRNKVSSAQEARRRKAPSPPDYNAGAKGRDGLKRKSPLCRLGPICKCAAKPCVEFITSPTGLKLTLPKSKSPGLSPKISDGTGKSSEYHPSIVDSSVQKDSVLYSYDSAESGSTKRAESNEVFTFENLPLNNLLAKEGQNSCENDPECIISINDNSVFYKEYVPPWKIYKVSPTKTIILQVFSLVQRLGG